jgi:hypothetical protein
VQKDAGQQKVTGPCQLLGFSIINVGITLTGNHVFGDPVLEEILILLR